jgi:hypothetical protein
MMKTGTRLLQICIPFLCGLALFVGPASATLIVDGDFNASGSYVPGTPHADGDPDQASSLALRDNGSGQDWYESRAYSSETPRKLMLYSNTPSGIHGNFTNVARMRGGQTGSGTGYAYLTQEFGSAQNSTFSITFDIDVAYIYDRSSGSDATGFIYVGDNHKGTNGPNSEGDERFVYLGFYDSGGGTSGQSLELLANNSSVDVLGTTDLWYDTWYTITLDIDVLGGTYDVTVDDKYDLHTTDVLTATGIAQYRDLDSLAALSFMVGGTTDTFGNGTYYVDNVSAVPEPGTLLLLGSGLTWLVAMRRRSR